MISAIINRRVTQYWFDKGSSPCFWPLYRLRVRLVRRFPWLYSVVWGDFRKSYR